jgi:AAA domain
MSILGTVTTGATRGGLRVAIVGSEKIGKTTLAAGAPASLLVPLEVGYAGIVTAKTQMLQTLEEFLQLLTEVTALARAGKFPFKSLVIDSATALERHIHDYVIRLDPLYSPGSKKSISMETAHGGYGKAYNLANQQFIGVLQQLDQLAVYGGINIIFTCHTFASKVSDPTAGEYDSYDILLHSPKNQKTYGKREILTQWADVVAFYYEPVFLVKAEGQTMTRATTQNKGRVLGLSRTPSYVAGNRFGIMGEVPIQAPPAIGWNNFADALYKSCGVDVFTR